MVHCNGLRFKVLPAYEEFEGKRWKMCFEEMVGADTCVILVL